MATRMRIAALAAPLLVVAVAVSSESRSDEVVQTQAGGVEVESLVKLDNPWGMASLPDGRLLVTEKPGRVRIYAKGTLSDPIEGVPAVVYAGQGGLLDVEIDPDFARNGRVYLSYTEAAEQQPEGVRLSRDPRAGSFTDPADNVSTGTAVASGRLDGHRLRDTTVIWRQVPKIIGRGHPGGRLVFAPDGKLFITSGERQQFDPAQDLGTNLGKVVRVNSDGSIPDDNPFVNRSGARPDVWTYGHRNPLGAAINPASNELWIDEMGPKGGDELNVVVRGRNYGWPVVSNGDHYDGRPIPRHSTRPDFEPPIGSWNPVISPSGLLFYTGERFPSWRGNALIGGLSSRGLVRLRLDGRRVKSEERIDLGKRIRDIAQAPDGAVLLLVDGDDGELLRLTPTAHAARR